MKPFILNRTDERRTRSVGRIVLYALVFFIVTRLGSAILVGIVQMIYQLGWDVNAMKLLNFLGRPEVMARQEGWWIFPDILQQQPVHFPHLTGTIPDVPRYLRCPLQHRSGYHR